MVWGLQNLITYWLRIETKVLFLCWSCFLAELTCPMNVLMLYVATFCISLCTYASKLYIPSAIKGILTYAFAYEITFVYFNLLWKVHFEEKIFSFPTFNSSVDAKDIFFLTHFPYLRNFFLIKRLEIKKGKTTTPTMLS